MVGEDRDIAISPLLQIIHPLVDKGDIVHGDVAERDRNRAFRPQIVPHRGVGAEFDHRADFPVGDRFLQVEQPLLAGGVFGGEILGHHEKAAVPLLLLREQDEVIQESGIETDVLIGEHRPFEDDAERSGVDPLADERPPARRPGDETAFRQQLQALLHRIGIHVENLRQPGRRRESGRPASACPAESPLRNRRRSAGKADRSV